MFDGTRTASNRRKGDWLDRLITRSVFSIAVCWCVLGLAVFVYRQAGKPPEAQFYYFRAYVAALGGAALLYGSAFFWSAKSKARLALITIYLAVNAYGLEGALAVRDFMRTPVSRRALLSATQIAHTDAVPALTPKYWVATNGIATPDTRVFPLSGLANRTTVTCKEGKSEGIYVSDEHGFNNPAGMYRRGSLNAALIGDSYVHGDCVKQGEDIAGQLRARGMRVLNLGMRGSGPLTELAILKEYAVPVAPKTLVWVFYEGNDIDDLESERSAPLLRRYLTPGSEGQHLFARQPDVESQALTPFLAEQERLVFDDERYERDHDVWLGVSRFLRLASLRGVLGVSGDRVPPTIDPAVWPLLNDVVVEAKSQVEQWGGNLLFVYFPVYPPSADRVARARYRSIREHVLPILRRHNISVLDLEPVLQQRASPTSTVACSGCHFTPEGYRLLADIIASALAAPPGGAR